VTQTSHTTYTISEILPSPFSWCNIEGGGVELAEPREVDDVYQIHFVVESFLLSKYPITYAQYQAFVDAPDGFRDSTWWDFAPLASRWRERMGQATVYHVSPDVPRMVTWYEAVAFCRWLTYLTGTEINLPTEPQWQRAALGDTGRKYPWGDSVDESVSNYGNPLGKQASVTTHPSGASPYGVWDMCGNMWEWTLTDWKGDNSLLSERSKVTRGGAWYNTSDMIQPTFSFWQSADVWFTCGFRICAPLDRSRNLSQTMQIVYPT
jgi:formylglycine-generating enzyme required for sulfatase activity